MLGGGAIASLALFWAAHLLNQAWSRSYRAETEQRLLALRLRASLDSLSQGVGVFDADKRLTQWNECFQVLLDLRRRWCVPGHPMPRLSIIRLKMAQHSWKARSRSDMAVRGPASRLPMSTSGTMVTNWNTPHADARPGLCLDGHRHDQACPGRTVCARPRKCTRSDNSPVALRMILTIC